MTSSTVLPGFVLIIEKGKVTLISQRCPPPLNNEPQPYIAVIFLGFRLCCCRALVLAGFTLRDQFPCGGIASWKRCDRCITRGP